MENRKYCFNKVFTGKYLNYNLGHEIINFIKDDNNRYIYINSTGEIGEEGRREVKYVFHILRLGSNYYEIIAISKAKRDSNCIYKKIGDESLDSSSIPKAFGHSFRDIFGIEGDKKM